MSHVEKQINLSDIEKQILWGLSSVTQELTNNYDIIIKSNFNVDPSNFDVHDWDEDKLNVFVSQKNPNGSGWSNKEFKLLLEEKVHVENLHEFLDSILNGGRGLDHEGVIKIIEEDRRAEKLEDLLEKKEKNGNLEMGGKNTVRLTKALTEFSKCLDAFVEGSSVQADSISNSKIVQWLEGQDPGRKVDGKNAQYLFGGFQVSGQLSFDENFYNKSDYIVLDSLGFPYKEKGFEEFVRTQPESGRFNYEELIAENVFNDQLPVVIPDVLPIDSYKGINLSLIDAWAAKIQGAAAIPGNIGLPAAYSLAAAGKLPYGPVVLGIITWKFVFMVGIPAVLIPRFLTGVAARTALFCEKLDGEFAPQASFHGKPTFFLYTNKKELALVAAFVKSPKLRRMVLNIHQKVDYGGLDKGYLDYMEVIEFLDVSDIKNTPRTADKLMLDYKGKERMFRYNERSMDTGVTSKVANSNKGGLASRFKDKFLNIF